MRDSAAAGESFGVLVGWAHHNFNNRVNLTLQCVQSSRRTDRREIDDHHIVMTPQQAAVLANYLYRISGQTPPEPRKGLLRRLLG
jgi:outer membrane PBP1 activator LpoA protein